QSSGESDHYEVKHSSAERSDVHQSYATTVSAVLSASAQQPYGSDGIIGPTAVMAEEIHLS
ncbi:hypothetical protein SK128_017813, partial [Halocaridina rubra]